MNATLDNICSSLLREGVYFFKRGSDAVLAALTGSTYDVVCVETSLAGMNRPPFPRDGISFWLQAGAGFNVLGLASGLMYWCPTPEALLRMAMAIVRAEIVKAGAVPCAVAPDRKRIYGARDLDVVCLGQAPAASHLDEQLAGLPFPKELHNSVVDLLVQTSECSINGEEGVYSFIVFGVEVLVPRQSTSSELAIVPIGILLDDSRNRDYGRLVQHLRNHLPVEMFDYAWSNVICASDPYYCRSDGPKPDSPINA